MSAPAAPRIPREPPEHLSPEVSAVWSDLVRRSSGFAPQVDAELFEAYCTLIVRWRKAASSIAEDGIVVGDEKKGAIVHPGLAAERALAEQIKDWSPLFNRPPAAKRKRGPMYDQTRRSITAAELDKDERFGAICEAVLTLAWLIDEAQRAGLEALQKATYNLIPTYVKGCAELQITPASLPADARKKAAGGKVDKFQRRAGDRRLKAVD